MGNKFGFLILLFMVFSEPVFAITRQSEAILSAFRRYELEFVSALRELKSMTKELDGDESIDKNSEAWLKAENIMGKVEDRYSSMEDLLNIASSKSPADRRFLQEGFSSFDDSYRKVRDYYIDNYTYKGQEEKKEDKEPVHESRKKPLSDNTVHTRQTQVLDSAKACDLDGHPVVILASDQQVEEKKVRVKGSLKFDYMDSNEKHHAVGMRGNVPNDRTQGRLLLSYQLNEKRSLNLEEKYIIRERNERIKENYLTFSYIDKMNEDKMFTFKNRLQHLWYQDYEKKNYRVNHFEGIYARNNRNYEQSYAFGIKSKVYPKSSHSDNNQYDFSSMNTWHNKNTTIFTDFKSEFVNYRNLGKLDYSNINFYAEIDKLYSRNKANIKVSNAYDRRLYEKESVVAYRSSYYDNYFNLDYTLPVNEKLTYSLNSGYTKRNYGSDEPRGYAELDVLNSFGLKTGDRTFLNSSYRYVYNDENTRSSAHKNHVLNMELMRKVNKNYQIKLNETYHERNSVENRALDFSENTLSLDMSWFLKNNLKLSWNTEHFNRRYDNISLSFNDYRYLESGFNLRYSKPRTYDWQLTQKWRNMEYRNFGGVATDWVDHMQPLTEVKFNKCLGKDLKFLIRAAWEKTYYREYSMDSQELEYNFSDLVYNKEIYASLEYIF